MKMCKIIFSIAIMLCTLLNNITAYADGRKMEATGYYKIIDENNDNLFIAKENAKRDALVKIVESIGAYIESETYVKDLNLNKDIIKSLAAAIVEIKSNDISFDDLDGNGMLVKCHIIANVDIEKCDINKIVERIKYENMLFEGGISGKIKYDSDIETAYKLLSIDPTNIIGLSFIHCKNAYIANGNIKDGLSIPKDSNNLSYGLPYINSKNASIIQEEIKFIKENINKYGDSAIANYILTLDYTKLKEDDEAKIHLRKVIDILKKHHEDEMLYIHAVRRGDECEINAADEAWLLKFVGTLVCDLGKRGRLEDIDIKETHIGSPYDMVFTYMPALDEILDRL